MSVEWKGKQVKAKLGRAIEQGMKETVSECIITSKSLVHIEFSVLQGSIRMDGEGVKKKGAKRSLQWGSFDVDYALWQEFLPGETIPDVGVRVRSGGKPYLRPSADEHYPELPGKIRAAFRRGA